MTISGKTIAISGVGGFIGLRLAERAIERGARVRGLEVAEAAAARARAAGASVIVGDVGDAEAARKLCQGADVVIHTAATVAAGGSLDDLRRVNVEGTRTILSAARDARVSHAVHLSSVMVYGFSFPKLVGEDGPKRGEGNPYCMTKIESEEVALGFDDPAGMRVVALRPGDVYGPGSRAWIVGPIELMKKSQFVLPASGRGVLNHVHVDNLIDAIFLALEKGAAGTAFNVTDGASTTCFDFYAQLAKLVGVAKVPTAPTMVLLGGLRVAKLAGRVSRDQAQELADALRFLTRPHPYSIEKARRELGYSPRVSLDEGMGALSAWLAAPAS
jgi:nucleoside-diphosphate-sugar epimerase